jgi:DNA-binding XRE family transcriptional regulator
MRHFATFLSNLRSSANISLEELATLVNTTRSTISRLENNEVPQPFKGQTSEIFMDIKKLAPIPGKAKHSRPMASAVANTLQSIYENNRVCETWGSPSVSRQTFNRLRREGFWVAGGYVMQRLQETGRPELSLVEKLVALVAGITIVTVANIFLQREKRPEMTIGEVRRFSPQAPKFPVAFYTFGAALLVAASGGGSSGGGGGGVEEGDESWSYPGSDTSIDYRAYSRPDEEDRAGQAEPEFLDDLDPGGMDSDGGSGKN